MSFGLSTRLLSLHAVCKRINLSSKLIAGLSTNTSYTSCEAVSTRKPSEPLPYLYDVKVTHSSKIVSCSIKVPQQVPSNTLSSLLEELTIKPRYVPVGSSNYKKEKYILPAMSDSAQKKILDPDVIHHCYKLPTFFDGTQEKLTPGLGSFAPKLDPDPLQRIIDEGSVPLVKITMPYLLRVRRHKMKKHKLKKFRKRMIFLHRKLSEIKKRKKEQQLVQFQQKWAKRAKEYDPEKHIDDQLLLARKGGYGVPLFRAKANR